MNTPFWRSAFRLSCSQPSIARFSRLTLTATLSLVLISLLASSSAAQVSPGFRLFNPLGSTDTELVDINQTVVHQWPSTFVPGVSVYMKANGNILRTIQTGNGPAGFGGGIQEMTFDGTVIWDFRYDGPGYLAHHDIEELPNGNVLAIAWEDKTRQQAIAEGRDPALINGDIFRPDHIIEVQPTGPTTGTIVWEWHIWDHLIQDFDSSKNNFGDPSLHPELMDLNYPAHATGSADWNHANSIEYDPLYDRIILSANRQDEIWVIDHSTTTAEAAGHTGGVWGKGGDLLYRWGNPAAYRAGTASDQMLFGQHSARVISTGRPGAGNYTVFNNRLVPASEVWEFVPPLDANGAFILDPSGRYGPTGPTWTYGAAGFSSSILSSAERLPNGNTLICSGQQGWVQEVTPSGTLVYDQKTGGQIFHAHYIERTFWADGEEISLTTGGSIPLEIIAGTPHAGAAYWILGSITGSSPGFTLGSFTVPLVFDNYTLWTLRYRNQPPLQASFGTLDGLGKATATFSIPPGLPLNLAGTEVHHACLTFGAGGKVNQVSNVVTFQLVQ